MTILETSYSSFESRPPKVGEVHVVNTEKVQHSSGSEYTKRLVRTVDESDVNPELRDSYQQDGDKLEAFLQQSRNVRGTEVSDGKVSVYEENLAAHWLYYDNDGQPTQLLEWASRFPTAIALEPLQRLNDGGKWLTEGGLNQRSLELFTNMVDGIGLRNRARIYTKHLVEYAEDNNLNKLDIISLGSGAAVPNIQATRRLEQQGKAVNWNFYDFDPQALMFAEMLAEENEFKYSTFNYGPMEKNIETGKYEPKGQSYVRAFGVEKESVDIVDALGLWEYLSPEHAVKFANKLFEKVKPGGSMIVSNMLPSRPQLQLNQKGVGWPGLYLRSDSDLVDIVENAGIDASLVTMTHSEDGVYVVMEIKKP